MGYVGNEPDVGFTSFAQQTITGNGGTSYTLSHAVANGKEILLYINNIKQEEGSSKAYTASGTTLTLSEAISSSDSCYCVFLGKALQTTVAPDGSVTSAKLANANLEMPNTLDMNGNELILDADGDTSITADTDDQIDFKTGGSDRVTIDNSGNLLVGKTSQGLGNSGVELREGAASGFTRNNTVMDLNRTGSDGQILRFRKDVSTIGNIGVATAGTSDENLYIANGDTGLRFRDNDNSIVPSNDTGSFRDNAIDLGLTNARFDDIRATNGTIQTSDENEKQDIASATAKELNVAKKLSTLFKTFRWKDKVAEKGDKARTHTGIVAQEVQSAFKAEGLDASNYGLFTSDTWTDDDGKEQTRLGVRYPELFSFIFSSIEARLTALEGN